MFEGRLPPGQRWIERLVVYDIGPVPPVDLGSFRLRLFGEVENPLGLSWRDILALPKAAVTRDFHCVTTWSVKGLSWQGVAGRTISSSFVPSPR